MNLQTAKARAKELVAQMTAEEKMTQLVYNAPAIERLGIQEYNWWNEALHGVARAGTATVFPQAIAMAAAFNPALLENVAEIIATEGRAKYNNSGALGDRDIFKGLTYWSPNINLVRDPRWGRGHETYGEDPCLTATLGKAFVRGLQGEGDYLKASACVKHFAAHSGPEAERHGFNSVVSKKDLAETYLPAFEQTVRAGVSGVMGAYSAINGIPANAHPLIAETVRGDWGFEGYFVSDCGAINDIYQHHHYVETAPEAAAVCLKAGCDLNCGDCYAHLIEAYEQDLIDEDDLTAAAEHLFTIRYLLGEFEPERPYADLPYDLVDCPAHRAQNLAAALETAVLVKNENGFLPLDPATTQKIGVVGPNALSVSALEGNYEGKASEYITAADGIRRVFTNADLRVSPGSVYLNAEANHWDGNRNMLSDGVAVAKRSDVTILCLGLNPQIEGECDDKEGIQLPDAQRQLAEAVCDVCENVVVLLLCGSSVDLGEKVRSHAKAILCGWYPGALGGLALAKLLAGEANPCGRLPLTFYSAERPLPPMEDYSMAGRTYRYLTEAPVWPFGFGLSYTTVEYESAAVSAMDETSILLTATLKNTGARAVNEKVQVYARYTDSRTATPNFQLCGLQPLTLAPGEEATVAIPVDRYWIKAVTEDGQRVEPDGEITLFIGGSQPDERSRALGAPACVALALQ